MTSSRHTKKILKDIVSTAAGRAVSILAPFLVMPALLKHLGEAGFGIWALAITATTALNFLDLGINNAALTRLSTAIGRNDRREIRTVLSSAYAILFVVAFALIVVATIASLIFVFFWPSQPGQPSNFELLAIPLPVILAFLIGLPLTITHRYFYAQQKIWISSLITSISAVFGIGFTLLSIHLEYGPFGVVFVYSFSQIVVAIFATAWIFFAPTEISPRLESASRPDINKLLMAGKDFVIITALNQIFVYSDTFIIGMKLGPESVTEYNIASKLASLLTITVSTLFLPLWAANSHAFARNDTVWIKRNLRNMSTFGFLLVAVLGGLLTLSADWIIGHWMHYHSENTRLIVANLSLASALLAIASPFLMVLNSVNETKIQIVTWAILIIVFIPLKYLLITSEHLWIAPAFTSMGYFLLLIPLAASRAYARINLGGGP